MPTTLLRAVKRAGSLALVALLGALLGACAVPMRAALPPGLAAPFVGFASARYGDEAMWLCRPDLPGDACHRDLTATEIRPDGSRVIAPFTPAKDAAIDCFYVYPTVDMGLLPGNQEDLRDTTAMQDAALRQAARFREVCDVYAPLYRQISIGTYISSQREARLAVAASDIEEAFLHYMGQYNRGRKIVLLGHSQGADMLARLLRRRFDGDPTMRERLLAALLIGMDIEVPRGRAARGMFANIPLCSAPEERGCVVAYRSFSEGTSPAKGSGFSPSAPGMTTACVSPAGASAPSPALATGAHPFSRSYFATAGDSGIQPSGAQGITTPFLMVRDLYAGACREDAGGFRFLAVSRVNAPGDTRTAPIDLASSAIRSSFGLHVLDIQIALGDLIDLVALKAHGICHTAGARAPAAPPGKARRGPTTPRSTLVF